MRTVDKVLLGAIGVVGMLLVGVLLTGALAWLLGKPTAPPPAAAPVVVQPAIATANAGRSGELTVDLGMQSYGFGSTNQARELLKLIEQDATKATYTITYRTTEDTTLFSANLVAGTLTASTPSQTVAAPENGGAATCWSASGSLPTAVR